MHRDVSNSPKATSHFTNSSTLIFTFVGLNVASLIFPLCKALLCRGGSPVISVSLGTLPHFPLLTAAACPVVLRGRIGAVRSHEYLGISLKQNKTI